MNKVIYIILLGVISCPAFGIGNKRDSLRQKKSGFIPFPILLYTPETKIGGGAALNYYFREPGSKPSSRPSTIMPSITYTQNKQIITELSADLYWKDEMYHLNGYLSYKKFPDKFYGIGNNTSEDDVEYYTPEIVRLSVNVQKKIYSELNAGVQYEFEQNKIIEFEKDGLIAQGNIPGTEGGKTSGIGLFANWDTRNNIFYPTSGSYFQLSASMFNTAMGSDYGFNRYNLDFRQYIPLFSSHAIALHGYMNIITGEPPFQKLSMIAGRIGGANLMRGYYEGRYRDKNMIAFQMEYRLPVWWRFGLVGFAAFGNVSDKIGNFELRNVKYSIGGGIRFQFSREEKLNIRLDFGYGKNSSGMYITIGEAF